MIRRDNADAVASAEKAIALARRFDQPETLALGLNMQGTALMMSGAIGLGVALLEESLDVARAHDLEHRIVQAHWMLGSGLSEMYELDRGEHELREHIAFAQERGLDSAYTRAWLAAVLLYRGSWREGTALAGVVLAQEVSAVGRITANVALGRVRARARGPGRGGVVGRRSRGGGGRGAVRLPAGAREAPPVQHAHAGRGSGGGRPARVARRWVTGGRKMGNSADFPRRGRTYRRVVLSRPEESLTCRPT
jgi:hypothetical protein